MGFKLHEDLTEKLEQNPGKVNGLLPACGVVAGPEQAMNTAMTVT